METSIAANFNGNTIVNGKLRSNGRFSGGEYVQIDGVANKGQVCSPNGLIGQDGNGLLLACQSGVWQKVCGGGGINTVTRYQRSPMSTSPSSTVSCSLNEKLVSGGSCGLQGSSYYLVKSSPYKNGWGDMNYYGVAEACLLTAFIEPQHHSLLSPFIQNKNVSLFFFSVCLFKS